MTNEEDVKPDTSNGEAGDETVSEITLDENSEVTTLKEQNRQLFARAKKAEGFEQDGDGKWVKAQKPEPKTEPKKLSKKSDELDYAQLAFHNTKSDVQKIESEEEVEWVKQQMEETGKSLQGLLNSKFFKTEYEAFKTSKVVDKAVPVGTGRSNQAPASQSVEYWLNKGDTEFPPDTYANKKLIIDIVNARYEKAKRGQ